MMMVRMLTRTLTPRLSPLRLSYLSPIVCQNDDGPSAFYAAAALSDRSILVAGTEYEESKGFDFVALKLDPSGDILWKWKMSYPTILR